MFFSVNKTNNDYIHVHDYPCVTTRLLTDRQMDNIYNFKGDPLESVFLAVMKVINAELLVSLLKYHTKDNLKQPDYTAPNMNNASIEYIVR